MARKSKGICFLEYVGLRLICAVVNILPYCVAVILADVLAAIAFDVFRFKHTRTVSRIRGCFPNLTQRECRQVAVKSLANLLLNAVEMMRAPHLSAAWFDRHVVDLSEYSRRLGELVSEGHGVVVMVPHTGNWYMAAWAMASRGLPLFALAARPSNLFVDAWFKRQYGTIDVLERGSSSSLREILKRLKAGQTFAILPDLRVPQRDVQVSFLGGTANVSHAGALFAVKTGSPIVVAAMSRQNGKHVFNHLATLRANPDAPDMHAEAIRLTQEAFKFLDKAVLQDPGQWFWYNKRWVLQPVGGKQ